MSEHQRDLKHFKRHTNQKRLIIFFINNLRLNYLFKWQWNWHKLKTARCASVSAVKAHSRLACVFHRPQDIKHLTHLSCETQLGGTCVLIGCSHRRLELDTESNQREMKEGRIGGTWLHALDP